MHKMSESYHYVTIHARRRKSPIMKAFLLFSRGASHCGVLAISHQDHLAPAAAGSAGDKSISTTEAAIEFDEAAAISQVSALVKPRNTHHE